MPNESKIVTNKLLSVLMSPSVCKLIDKISRPNEVTITNGEIETAMLAIKCDCVAAIEAVLDEYHDYKQQQEQNVEKIVHYMGELFKQENNLQQRRQLEQQES